MAWFYHEHVNSMTYRAKQSSLTKESSLDDKINLDTTTNEIISITSPVLRDTGHVEEEKTIAIENQDMIVSITSWGGAIKNVTLKHYKANNIKDSPPLLLDFSNFPSLAYIGISGLSTNNDFELTSGEDGRTVNVFRKTDEGLIFTRTFTLNEKGYQINICDKIALDNSLEAYEIPQHSISIGSMMLETSKVSSAGGVYLGVDTLAEAGGEGVHHWGSQIPALFGYKKSFFSCGSPKVYHGMPVYVTQNISNSVLWAAVKNKFFVQIVSPSLPAVDCTIVARRMIKSDNSFGIEWVGACLVLKGEKITPLHAYFRSIDCYIGPKLQSAVAGLGLHKEDVMEFGRLKWICNLLLQIMNKVYMVIPNYGVVIIILSLLVKGVFWPITHKGAKSMKKMQEIQPEVNQIREKYKDKPQKMNQEIMELYRKHKINPMAGCLPLIVQLPVLFALFTVLRSAVELRFAPFLWIRDLSEPEGLFANILPIAINILPIMMTILTVIQQYLTPSSGDPNQKKMMMYMTFIMLFMFYNMASALVLYWTVNQFISTVGLLWQKYRQQNIPALTS